jgi:hypothetical protein
VAAAHVTARWGRRHGSWSGPRSCPIRWQQESRRSGASNGKVVRSGPVFLIWYCTLALQSACCNTGGTVVTVVCENYRLGVIFSHGVFTCLQYVPATGGQWQRKVVKEQDKATKYLCH